VTMGDSMTTEPTTRDMQAFLKAASPIMAELVADHNDGRHRERARTGCPGCLLASAEQ
jgi:hypothetical protein